MKCQRTFVFVDNAGISSLKNSRCDTEQHLSGAPSDFVAVNCGPVESTVGNLSHSITGRQLPQIHSGANDELITEEPSVPLLTAGNQMTSSVAPIMQIPHMTEQVITMDNARHCGSMVQICVFSTELANRAAESVHVGCHDSIVDFHQDYCAAPVTQVY